MFDFACRAALAGRFARLIRQACGRRFVLACAAWPLVAAIAACSTPIELVPSSNAWIDSAALDRMNAEGDRMIVVAVANPNESVPVLAGTTVGAYGGAPGYAAYGSARATIAALAEDYHLQQVMAWPIVPLSAHCAVLEVMGRQTRAQVLERLAKDRRVRIAQPLQSFSTLSDVRLPRYDADYGDLQQGSREVDVRAAHRVTQGQGVRIAVIDTGVDTAHPALAGQIALARDLVDADKAQFTRDLHGTAVAGVIAAKPTNGHGIIGVAPRARILALKACWQTPSPDGRNLTGPAVCNSVTLALALTVAAEAHADIINLSLSGPPDPLLTQLVDSAVQHGVVVVGAMPPNGDARAFPVGIAHVIAADASGSHAPASVIRAPGRDVLTLTPGGHYDFMSGSSFSAAYVSGVAALVLAAVPGLDATHLLAALKSASGVQQVVDACAALVAAGGTPCEAQTVSR